MSLLHTPLAGAHEIPDLFQHFCRMPGRRSPHCWERRRSSAHQCAPLHQGGGPSGAPNVPSSFPLLRTPTRSTSTPLLLESLPSSSVCAACMHVASMCIDNS